MISGISAMKKPHYPFRRLRAENRIAETCRKRGSRQTGLFLKAA